ncbi:hypothetical protein FACS1894204_07670 [Synergistales bacterium]|nr:hypothetical protein FACS1894204_07670 [Synergistales bacterium]
MIPARGGSKSIRKKNIALLMGKPLISYTFLAAKGSRYIDDIILSTDSAEIIETAKNYGIEVPFVRPAELAEDHSKIIDAVIHAIKALSDLGRVYDVLILLQPTSPLRTNSDIDVALEKFIKYNEESLVSVSPVADHPILIRSINERGYLQKIVNQNSTVRRQDMVDYYRVNGCIYINKISDINQETSFNDNIRAFVMQDSHSVDIDDMIDLEMAEFFLRKS